MVWSIELTPWENPRDRSCVLEAYTLTSRLTGIKSFDDACVPYCNIPQHLRLSSGPDYKIRYLIRKPIELIGFSQSPFFTRDDFADFLGFLETAGLQIDASMTKLFSGKNPRKFFIRAL